MAKNTLTLIITADGKKALDTINATSANLRKLSTQTYELEKRIKAGNEVSASMADAYRLINDLVNRHVIAQKQLNPSINENEAALKAWGEAINTVSTQGGALGSETLEYLKMQYASVAEQIQKATEQITNESKPIEDTAKSVEEVSKATTNLAVSTKKASSYWSKLFDTTKNVLMFRVIMNVINSISNLSNFLNDSVQAAAEAEQVFSKLNTVFGETSGAMAEVVSLASQIGVASSTAASALSTVGDLLQAQGQTTTQSLETATEWVSQFQDIIAFKDINMSLEEFAQNFMSGAAGNLRNFRTFGSIVRESAVNAELAKKGLDKLTGSELELAKMTTRAEMALEQQKNAIGATQREWDTMLSVERRYNEALKSLKEDTGEQIQPIVKWWLELKTSILKALDAESEYERYKAAVSQNTRVAASMPTFGVGLDEKKYLNNLKYLNSDLRQASRNFAKTKDTEALKTEIAAIAMKYGATQDDLTKFLDVQLQINDAGYQLSETFLEVAHSAVAEKESLIEANEALIKSQSEMVNTASSVDSLFESMQGLRNVNFIGEDWYTSFVDEINKAMNGDIDMDELEKKMASAISNSVSEAISDIKSMSSTIPEAIFSEDAMEDILNTRIDAYESLYEMAYSSGKFEQKQLELIIEGWKDAKAALEEYQSQKINESSIQGIISGGFGVIGYSDVLSSGLEYENYLKNGPATERLSSTYKLQGLYQEAKAIADKIGDTNLTKVLEEKYDEELKNLTDYYDNKEKLESLVQIDSAIKQANDAVADYGKQLRQIDMSETEKTLDDLNAMLEAATDEGLKSAIEAQIAAFNELTKATDERTRREELEAKKKEIGEVAAGYTQTAVDYRRQARQLGLSEYEIAMQNYDEEFFRLRDEYNAAADELKDSIYDQIIAMLDERLAYMELTEATEAYNQQQAMQQAWENLGSQATGAFGEFGTLVTSLDSLGDVLGGGGGLLSILIDILAQTEVATRLSSLLTDSILPTLNAFLEPLLPIIDMLSEAIKSLVEIVLVPLFPILQGIASTLALVIGSVMTGLDLIANGVKKTIGYIVSGIENAVNWIIDMFNKIPGVNIGKVSFGPSNWADIDLQGVLEEDMAWIGDTLEKIAESNMEISDNTDPAKDFSTYQKLLAAKEIDEATYNRWTGMDKYTTQSLANGVSYAQGNRSYINVNNLTVQAPEGMTLVDFLKGIEDYNSGHSPYAVNTMAV